MLSCPCFGNYARLAHAASQHGLADGIVDFVRAGVIQVFTLEIDLSATLFVRHACGVVDRRWTPDKMRQFVLEFTYELGIMLIFGVGVAQFTDGVSECLGGKTPAIPAKMATGIGLIVSFHDFGSISKVHRRGELPG